MADAFKEQCEKDAIFWQTWAANFARAARISSDNGSTASAIYCQQKAADAARRAMINLFAII